MGLVKIGNHYINPDHVIRVSSSRIYDENTETNVEVTTLHCVRDSIYVDSPIEEVVAKIVGGA